MTITVQISKFKQEARKLKRKSSLTHTQALEVVAKKYGYTSWQNAFDVLQTEYDKLSKKQKVDLATKMTTALDDYRSKNGVRWKSKLNNLFSSGCSLSPSLQYFRNNYLPVLPKIKFTTTKLEIMRLLK